MTYGPANPRACLWDAVWGLPRYLAPRIRGKSGCQVHREEAGATLPL